MAAIDIGAALDLLAADVEQRGVDFVDQQIWTGGVEYLTCCDANGPQNRIVGQALAVANVAGPEVDALHDGLRDLYLKGRPPVVLTLGALVVCWTRPSAVRVAVLAGATYSQTRAQKRSSSSTCARQRGWRHGRIR
jgi:hypothetical protein